MTQQQWLSRLKTAVDAFHQSAREHVFAERDVDRGDVYRIALALRELVSEAYQQPGWTRFVPLVLCLLSASCASAPVKRDPWLVPISIPAEDRICVERWPAGMNRWHCISIEDLRELLQNLAQANP